MIIFLLGAIVGLLLGVIVIIFAMIKFNLNTTSVFSTLGGYFSNNSSSNKEGK
jgi:hypothetical protein